MKYNYEAKDIFSGCGGVSCGLTLSGFEIKAAVEIDDKAAERMIFKNVSNSLNKIK